MEVTEAQKLKKKLDQDIFKLVKDFEQKTGTHVLYIITAGEFKTDCLKVTVEI